MSQPSPRAFSPRFGAAVVTADRVVLRPWERNEVGWIFDSCQDPAIQRWTTVPSPYTAADAVAFLELAEASLVNGEAAHLAIADVDTGWLHGAVSLGDRGAGGAEVGYWVAAESRGRGVARAAVGALVAWGFGALGFDRMTADVLVGNDTSAAVLRACGFEEFADATTCDQRGEHRPARRFLLRRPAAAG